MCLSVFSFPSLVSPHGTVAMHEKSTFGCLSCFTHEGLMLHLPLLEKRRKERVTTALFVNEKVEALRVK